MTTDRDRVIKTYADHVYPGKVAFYEKYDITLVPEKREGCVISDMNGKPFYNCHCNRILAIRGYQSLAFSRMFDNLDNMIPKCAGYDTAELPRLQSKRDFLNPWRHQDTSREKPAAEKRP